MMREIGLRGVRRGKPKCTTIADSTADRAQDLVRRQFHAARPNKLWVCDMTYLRTWVGFAYLVLVIDVYSRRLGRLGADHAPAHRPAPGSLGDWRSGPATSGWTG